MIFTNRGNLWQLIFISFTKLIVTVMVLLTISVQSYCQGFSTSAFTWPLPSGGKMNSSGEHNFGFNVTSGDGAYYNGSNSWSLMDLNGDYYPDLIVTSEGDGTYRDAFGMGSNPHWKVYFNNKTSGFSKSAVTWALPSGGKTNSAGEHNYGFNVTSGDGAYYNGSNSWSLMDLNGDYYPDLIVTSEGDGTYRDAFGMGSNPHWKVYFNKTVSSLKDDISVPPQKEGMFFLKNRSNLLLSILETSQITVILYNLKGKKLAELFNGNAKEGMLRIPFDFKTFSTGVYPIVIKKGRDVTVKKLVVK